MSERLTLIAAKLLQKHIPKGIEIDVTENWDWLENPDQEDVELLLSVKDEIRRKLDSLSLRYSEGWFTVLYRRINCHDKLREMILT